MRFALPIMFALAAVEAPAQQHLPPVGLEQERPIGLSEKITAVTRGRVQIEAGYAYVHDRYAGAAVSEHLFPDMLARIGITQRLELRLGWPGLVHTNVSNDVGRVCWRETLAPNVGLLYDLSAARGLRPQTAVSVAVPITTGGSPFALESLQPLAEVLYAWYPADDVLVGGSTGFARFVDAGDHFLQFQQSVHADYLLTERIGTYVEWEMLTDCGSVSDGSQHLLGAGLSFWCTDHVQLGWRAGCGLNDRAPDFLTDVRVALRF